MNRPFPNPLAVHNLREVSHLPPHFTTVEFDARLSDRALRDWLHENLSGRFYVGDIDRHQNNRSFERKKVAAFELGAEASYFSLLLPQINAYDTAF